MSDEILYRVAVENDRHELYELFKNHYVPNEPFNRGWINDDPVPEDIELTLKSLAEDTSFVAIDVAKNIIVGACMTGVDEASSQQTTLDEANRTPNKKFAEYLKLYVRIDKMANIYQRYNVERIFHVYGLSVKGDYGGRSIATKLVQKSFDLGASLGHTVCTINCSSFYTELIARKLKMECVNELAMEKIRSETGERLVFSAPPHTHIRTYVKRLWWCPITRMDLRLN